MLRFEGNELYIVLESRDIYNFENVCLEAVEDEVVNECKGCYFENVPPDTGFCRHTVCTGFILKEI